uniref:Uncharacterized protein n=2 Tax=viral metagenome TaxID=1070528 RepID=A0A6H1Z798_9ZZZZ
MAEGRMLKRAIATSKKMAELETDSARLLYTWFIPFLDVEGRFYGDPDVIKGSIVPRIKDFTAEKVKECLADMQRVGLILWYLVNDDKYLQFTVFEKHQNINRDRESKLVFPAPEDSCVTPEDVRVTPSNVLLSKDKLSKDKLSKYKESDFQSASLLKNLILENIPSHKITDKQLESWANETRLMREQDNHTIEEINDLIQWSQKHYFWKANILSMGKLREKWNTLWMQRKKGNNYQQPNKRPLSESDERLKEQYRKEEAEEKND